MLRPGEVLDVTVERPAVGGVMIARDIARGGAIVLVSGAIPGERVSVRVDRVTRSVAFASTVTVHEPSVYRRPAFDDPLCGGCLYSHITYARQLQIKSEVIADAFARLGRIQLPAPVGVAGSTEEGYRMRARLHVRGRRIGFFREGTHDVCDARLSRQLLPATCDVIDRLGDALRSLGGAVREIELSENLAASERVVYLDASEPIDRRVLASATSIDGLTRPPYVTDALHVGDHTFRLRRHVLAFFQGNRSLLRELVRHVVDLVPSGGAVLDLYSGVGLFSIPVAMLRSAIVHAVELDAHAAADLAANSLQAGDQVRAIRADVDTFAGGYAGRVDVVIVDPPRTGLSRAAVDGVLTLRPPTVIYVSCDVATLARDARRILDGGYTIDRADAFDLFPNTPHVETVVAFKRSRSQT
jgi:23S rRNA (uracil1939-C5)-methyltransferase